MRFLLILALLLPAAASAADLSTATDAELTVLAADPDWTVRLDASLEQALRTDPDLTARRMAIAPRATRAGFLRFPTQMMNVPDAAPVLLHRFRTESAPEVRGALADCLSRLSVPWADAVVELMADEPDATVRSILVHAVRFIPPPQARALVVHGMADADAVVRAETASLIARRSDGLDFADALVPALADPAERVRISAARTLGTVQADVSEALVPLLSDGSSSVRLHALRALDRIDGPRAAEQARTLDLVSDLDARVSRLADRILGR